MIMKPAPKNFPRISSSLVYENASEAIDWLCRAFGFEVRLKVEGDEGTIVHSELTFGDGLIMVGETAKRSAHPDWTYRMSPNEVGGVNTQTLMIYVDDVEAHCTRARAAGAKISQEIEVHDYGEDYWADKSYGCIDPGGHHWWITQRMRDPQGK
jgi:uncharacterized glyoxalase superfamily protein PhnB